MNRMKGSAAIMTIMIILILVLFLLIYWNILFKTGEKSVQLNLDESDIVRAKNTVSLINRSLYNTWHVSAAQALFLTGMESVGCGIDDLDIDEIYQNRFRIKEDILDENYWYQYNPKETKDDDPLALVITGNKYNIDNFGDPVEPRICYPTDIHLQEYIEKKFLPFTQIEEEFRINGMGVEIKDILPQAGVTDDALNMIVNQKILVTFLSGNVDFDAKTNVVIDTKMRNLVSSGRNIVDAALDISDTTKSGALLDAQDRNSEFVWLPNIPSKDVYATFIKSLLEQKFRNALEDGVALDSATKIEVGLRAKNDEAMSTAEKDGLLVHYNADIKLREQVAASALSCTEPPDNYKVMVENAVKNENWDFGAIQYSDREIISLVYGIINTESHWNPILISNCGAVGLMQIMPGTAADQGLDTFQDADHTDCDTAYAQGLLQELQTNPDIESEDERFNAQRNIEAGVRHLHDIFLDVKNSVSSSGRNINNVRKLSIAAYNTGVQNIDDAKACANSGVWEDIVSANCASGETINYVPAVIACAEHYKGGTEFVGGFEWPTDSRRITSCFGLRTHPVTGEIKAHIGLDIGTGDNGEKNIISVAGGTVEKIKNDCAEGDVNCGGGYGNFIRIDHGNYETFYGHLKEGSIAVTEGQHVSAGEIIAEMGNSGLSTATHLHLEIRDDNDDEKKNPCNFFDCSESTKNQCTGDIDLSIFPSLYYFHDEGRNEFNPRPFSLRLKAEDTLHAINCVYQEELATDGNTRPDVLYSWENPGDFMCCGGYLWSCNADVPEIGNHGLRTGQRVDENLVQEGAACADRIANYHSPGIPGIGAVIDCTGSGFDIGFASV